MNSRAAEDKSRGTIDQLMIDKIVMKNCKRIMKNLSVAWIDYTKAYDMVLHTWILQCLKIFKVANISIVIEKSTKNWKVELTSGGLILGEVKINRDTFQGDILSLILFVITMIPLTTLLLKIGKQDTC